MVPVISGVTMKGMARMGLSMIGMPKITGSLMLKKARPHRQFGDLFHLFAAAGNQYRQQQADSATGTADAHIYIPERHGNDIRHLFALLERRHVDHDRA